MPTTTSETMTDRWAVSILAEDLVTGVTEWMMAAPEPFISPAALCDHIEASRGVKIIHMMRCPVPNKETHAYGFDAIN